MSASTAAIGSGGRASPSWAGAAQDAGEERSAVAAIVQPDQRRIERFSSSICVRARGASPEFNADVETQLTARARELGLKVAGERCRPNLEVVINSDQHAYARRLISSAGASAQEKHSGQTITAAATDAILVWVARAKASPEPDRHVRFKVAGREFDDVSVGAAEATLLPTKRDTGLVFGIVSISEQAAQGKTAIQIADYAAMRLLGNTASALPASETILRLFAGDWKSSPQLTRFDEIYLHALYRSPSNSELSRFIRQTGDEISTAASEGFPVGSRRPPRETNAVEKDAEAFLETGKPARWKCRRRILLRRRNLHRRMNPARNGATTSS